MDNHSEQKNTPKVFIVEDDMLLSLVQERLIEKLGYKVVGKTAKGLDAVEQVKELNPDLVLMDIILKGEMDGVEATRAIRNDPQCRGYRTPIVALTASVTQEDRERCQAD